jgi:large subunit ribosomal protein L18
MALIVKRAKGKTAARSRRHFRVRKVVTGTAVRPRLVVVWLV